ncbi:MAG: DUF1445 domain-containing protein [Chloroflexi bacterium]|nr:DUF1445 domain-containing protein [Chloroflexota bacterium]
MKTTELTREQMAALAPAELRLLNRKGQWPEHGTTQFCCRGYTQHTIVVLPRDWAADFFLFCQRNPRPCYIADVTDPGSPHPMLLALEADVRTDVSRYRVFRDGEAADEPRDILKYWRDDLMTFFLPCSFSFEGMLRDAHVEFRHIGLYETDIPTRPAGRFVSVPVMATGRVFRNSHDAVRASAITTRYPVSHGHPIHIGNPPPGYRNISHTTDWTAPPSDAAASSGEVALFHACAYTAETAIKAARPPFAMMHVINNLFVSDRRVEEFACGLDAGAAMP